jgi:hypothetical protein
MLYFISRNTILIFLLSLTINAQSNFSERQTITTDFFWRTPHNICASDLDGDGDEDIIVGNYGGNSFQNNQLMWFRNLDGTGTFGSAIMIPSSDYSMMTSVQAADLDGDGDMDVIASDDGTQIAWFENTDGMGSFSSQKVLTNNAAHSNCIITADMDRDGDLDIISLSYLNSRLVFWFENIDGRGNFAAEKIIYSTATFHDACDNMSIDDLNGDNYPDIVIDIFQSNIVRICFIKNNGNGSFNSPVVIAESSSSPSIITADIDNDNDKDIIITSTEGLLLLENTDGHATFSNARVIGSSYTGVAFPEDIDNDNDIDILWVDTVDKLVCYINNGSGSFTHTIISNTLNNPGVICTSDFDNDGDRDILIGGGRLNPGSIGEIKWYENLANATDIQNGWTHLLNTFQLYQNYPNPFNPTTIIRFSIPQAGNVSLEIYNLLGQKLETLVNEYQTAGEHQFQWKPDELSSGIYLAMIRTGSQMRSMKFILQK